MQAIGSPFVILHSSNSIRNPKHFVWTEEDCPIKVFIDIGIRQGLLYQKKEGEKKIAWLCEPRSIFHLSTLPRNVWESNISEIAESFDMLFTSERDMIGRHPNIKYCPAGSNLPWTQEWNIHSKTKLTSMIVSPKRMTFGHQIRHSLADMFKDRLDLYGGAFGSKRIGTTIWDKSEGLNDYMFSIVVENDSYSTYYTEKITDCFATGTIPVYWGAPDIGEIFNENGIIKLTPEFDLNSLTPELYYSKMEAIQDNFNRLQTLEGADDQLFKLINNL